ncbi:hypothetical protein [Sphingomonas sp. BAUL-RG-20F-R05-02]|uniref:hypothetical protein n=1 Tax=Sphingomonas sp. BAUL-RG-20F-R05-02 TaxID=2914830 RepID=UPI001F58A752|nr:hypothetical protein [Sphingomonas sp. BAUL-RG-20F-R05-02]
MTDGIQINDANGKLQFNGEMQTYALRLTGTAYVESRAIGNTCPTSVLIPTTDTYSNALIALGNGNGYAAAYAGRYNNQRIYATNSAPAGTPFDYYIFERSNLIPATNFGLEVRNANNEITFSSNQRVMSIPTILGNPGLTDGGSPSATYGGRTLAYCQANFAGHTRKGGVLYSNSNGGPLIADGTGPWWRYSQDGKVYGAVVSNNRQTVTTKQISWSDVQVRAQTANQPLPDDVTRDVVMFVVDVTGIPIGQQFF